MIADAPDGAILTIRVIPRAGRTTVAGTRDGALLIRLAAAPVDGAANNELIALLARVLGVARRRLVLISGETSRAKRVKVLGVTVSELRARLDTSPHAG